MRKGILGLLAYGLAGLNMAHGQTGGGYQEPLPIQVPGSPYGTAPYVAPTFARFPSYAPSTYPNFPMQQSLPASGAAAARSQSAGSQRTGIVQASAQEPLAPFKPWTPVFPDVPGGLPVQTPLSTAPDGQPPHPETGKPAAHPNEIVGDVHHLDEGPAPEPAEPYMASPVGTWKPAKGYNFYGSAEYLLWFTKAQQLPGQLSLSLSDPNFAPRFPSRGESGGRFTVGSWLNDRQDLSFEGSYFFLGQRSATTNQTFPGSAIAQKPIFDGIVSESVLVSSSTSLWGAEANARYEVWRSHGDGAQAHSGLSAYLDFLGGFRFVDLSESLLINNSTLFGTAPVLLSNALLSTSDSFGTHNHLYAGQLGAEGGVRWGRLSFNVYSKLALGDNRETVIINGNTQVSGQPILGNISAPGGFLAQPSNSGRFSHDEFTVLPEAGLNIGYKLGDHCRLGAGYSFLYFSHVVRPGEQIDVAAAGGTRPPLFFLGGARPQPAFTGFNQTTFWAQGVNFTVELSY